MVAVSAVSINGGCVGCVNNGGCVGCVNQLMVAVAVLIISGCVGCVNQWWLCGLC